MARSSIGIFYRASPGIRSFLEFCLFPPGNPDPWAASALAGCLFCPHDRRPGKHHLFGYARTGSCSLEPSSGLGSQHNTLGARLRSCDTLSVDQGGLDVMVVSEQSRVHLSFQNMLRPPSPPISTSELPTDDLLTLPGMRDSAKWAHIDLKTDNVWAICLAAHSEIFGLSKWEERRVAKLRCKPLLAAGYWLKVSPSRCCRYHV